MISVSLKAEMIQNKHSTKQIQSASLQPIYISTHTYIYIHTYFICPRMTQEIKAINKQYGTRRSRLSEHLLLPLKLQIDNVSETLHKTSKINVRK